MKMKMKFAIKMFVHILKEHKKGNVYTLTYTTTNTPVSLLTYAFDLSKKIYHMAPNSKGVR